MKPTNTNETMTENSRELTVEELTDVHAGAIERASFSEFKIVKVVDAATPKLY